VIVGLSEGYMIHEKCIGSSSNIRCGVCWNGVGVSRVAGMQQGVCYAETRMGTLSTCKSNKVTLFWRIFVQTTPYIYDNTYMKVLSYMYMCNSTATYLCVCVFLYLFK
jgi:hypothetical protein